LKFNAARQQMFLTITEKKYFATGNVETFRVDAAFDNEM